MSTCSSVIGEVRLEYGQFTINGSNDMPDLRHLVRESRRSYAFAEDGVVAFDIASGEPTDFIVLQIVIEERNDAEQRLVECDVEFGQDAFVMQLMGESPQDEVFSRPVAGQGRYQVSIDDELPLMFTVYLTRLP